jgi:hypothetical protein
MNEQAHRNYQNLPKIGAVYSTKDEKQRALAEEILNFRVKPEMKLKINMNIPGLEKKKTISPLNPSTRRWFNPLSVKGKQGWLFVWTMPNVTRFLPPALCVAFLFYCGETLVAADYYKKKNNDEWEGVYCKMQTIPGHYIDRWSLMA